MLMLQEKSQNIQYAFLFSLFSHFKNPAWCIPGSILGLCLFLNLKKRGAITLPTRANSFLNDYIQLLPNEIKTLYQHLLKNPNFYAPITATGITLWGQRFFSHQQYNPSEKMSLSIGNFLTENIEAYNKQQYPEAKRALEIAYEISEKLPQKKTHERNKIQLQLAFWYSKVRFQMRDFKKEQPDSLTEQLNLILIRDPENVDALNLRGLTYLHLKEFSKARQDFQKSFALSSTQQDIYLLYLFTQAQAEKDPTIATNLFGRINNFIEMSSLMDSEIGYELPHAYGITQRQLKNYDRAIDALKLALHPEQLPSASPVYYPEILQVNKDLKETYQGYLTTLLEKENLSKKASKGDEMEEAEEHLAPKTSENPAIKKLAELIENVDSEIKKLESEIDALRRDEIIPCLTDSRR